MLLALWMSVAWACDEPLTMGEVGTLAASFEGAFFDRDKPRLLASYEALFEGLHCLREPLVPPDAARLHRIEGMMRFFNGERQQAIGAFGSARALEPAYELPLALASEQHPMRVLYEGLPATPAPSTEALASPKEGWVQLDGVQRLERPLSRPAVFQRFTPDGAVAQTAYLQSSDTAPTYEVASPADGPDLTVFAGALYYDNGSAFGSGMGTLELRAGLPILGSLRLDVGGGVGIAPEVVPLEGQDELGATVLPKVEVGARWRGTGATRPWLGAYGGLLFHGAKVDDATPNAPEERSTTPLFTARGGLEQRLAPNAAVVFGASAGVTRTHDASEDGWDPLLGVQTGLSWSL